MYTVTCLHVLGYKYDIENDAFGFLQEIYITSSKFAKVAHKNVFKQLWCDY